ncbi:MAG: nucleotidyltransferase domain-containing protein [Pyrobaculum sp.]
MSNQPSASLTPKELEKATEIAVEGVDAVAVYLFGSAARGRFVRGLSDVDIIVVTKSPPPYRAKTSRIDAGDINVVYMSAEEICEAYRRGNHLVIEALDEGILLAGTPLRCADRGLGARYANTAFGCFNYLLISALSAMYFLSSIV